MSKSLPKRRVYFSFHYERDIWRANQVRNSWVTHGAAPQFIDAADWETVKRRGRRAIQRWIDAQMKGTSVTCVLIGAETADREWVLYEIERSLKLGRGLLGIRIHQLKNKSGDRDWLPGDNPFAHFAWEPKTFWESLLPRSVAEDTKLYDWLDDKGRQNIGSWVDRAYLDARARRKDRDG